MQARSATRPETDGSASRPPGEDRRPACSFGSRWGRSVPFRPRSGDAPGRPRSPLSRLTPLAAFGSLSVFLVKTMGKQYNKVIKRRRRNAYLKRRRAAAKAAKKK